MSKVRLQQLFRPFIQIRLLTFLRPMVIYNRRAKTEESLATLQAKTIRKRARTEDILTKFEKQKPPQKKRTKALICSKEQGEMKIEPEVLRIKLPILEAKTSPYKLFTLFNELNKEQRKSFRKSTLGFLLDLQVGRLSSQLAYYVLEKYNTRTQSIELKNGALRISPKNVNLTMGLPMGSKSMMKLPEGVTFDQSNLMIDEWTSQFKDKKGNTVQMLALKNLILEDKEGVGPNFIRNMVMYIITCLIFCKGGDNVFLDIVPHLQDVDKLHELNWCEFVFDKLTTTREKWTPGKPYSGPILFLLLHYVDMVVDSKRDIPRDYPRFFGWTTNLLNARQSREKAGEGGFGGGYIDHDEGEIPPNPPKARLKRQKKKDGKQSDSSEEETEQIPSKGPENEVNKGPEVGRNESEKEDRELFYDYVKVIERLANAMSDYQEMTDKITTKMPNHSFLMKLVEKSRTAFDLKPVTTTQEQRNKEDHVYRLSQDLFWEDPEVYKIIDDIIEKCRIANECLKSGEEIEPPSFSLGLTQELANVGVVNVEEQNVTEGNVMLERNEVFEERSVVIEGNVVLDGNVVLEGDVVLERNEVFEDRCEVSEERHVVVEKEKGKVAMVEERSFVMPEKKHEEEPQQKINEEEKHQDDDETTVQRGGKEKMQEEQHTDKEVCQKEDETPKRTIKIKIGKYDKSPYVSRIVDSKSPPNLKESLFAKYLSSFDLEQEQRKIENVAEEADSIKLFGYKGFGVLRPDLITLAEEKCWVEVNVVNAFTLLLNYKERLRSPDSPKRFFATAEAGSKIINVRNMKVLQPIFNREMDGQIKDLCMYKDIREIDVFLFPFCGFGHYFVFSISLKSKRFDVLYNSSVNSRCATPLVNYNHCPEALKVCFAEWLTHNNCEDKAAIVQKMKIVRTGIQWRDTKNVFDCAIFAMRHMETYMGAGVNGWDAGLSPNTEKAINILRIRYASEFAYFEHNECKDFVRKEMEKFNQRQLEDQRKNPKKRQIE